MKNKIGFGSFESIALMLNLAFAQILLIFPRDVVTFGGSASWMIPIIIMLIAIIYFAIMMRLYKNLGNLDLIDISYGIGGRVSKVVIGLLISIFLILIISVFLGAFSQTLKIISLDKSPLEYVLVLFLIGMAASAYYGVEAVARIHAILVPIIIICFLLITIGVIPEFNTNNLFPIFGEGYLSILKGSILKLSVFSFFIILFFMVPFFKNKYLKRVGYSTIFLSGLLLLWSTLSFILVFPYEVAVNKKIPIYQIARYIEFGDHLQRIESIFVLICSVSGLLFLGVLFTFLTHIFAKALDLKQSRPIILPLITIVCCLGLLSRRINMELLGNSVFNIVWLAGMVIPLVIAIIGAAKKVGVKNKGGVSDEQKD